MILDLNKKLTIFLMLFFVSCSKDEVTNNVEKDVYNGSGAYNSCLKLLKSMQKLSIAVMLTQIDNTNSA